MICGLRRGGMASFGATAHSVMMPTPTTTHGDDFTCRHCGALYVVSNIELPIADSGSVYCQVCRRQMIQWNSILQPSYRLVKQPDPKRRITPLTSLPPRARGGLT